MAKMLQLRNVPDRLHREIARRARLENRSIAEYVQRVLEREVACPPREEVFVRIASRKSVRLGRPASDLIGAERRGRRAS